MAFPCPACGGAVDRSPEGWAVRCPSCGRRLRCRAVEGGGPVLSYEVEVAGRPETRRRVEVAWDQTQHGRLSAWLGWSTAVALGLVALLYALARWYRP